MTSVWRPSKSQLTPTTVPCLSRGLFQRAVIYLLEIDFTLGQIRADGLPKLAKDQSGWEIVARPKISVPETKAKALVKDRLKLLKKIQEEHADSPWSYFAERESKRDLGMEWAAKKK